MPLDTKNQCRMQGQRSGYIHIKPDYLTIGIIAFVEVWRCAVEKALDEENVIEPTAGIEAC